MEQLLERELFRCPHSGGGEPAIAADGEDQDAAVPTQVGVNRYGCEAW